MKKLLISIAAAAMLLPLSALAAETYDFESSIGNLTAVNNTLGTGGNVIYEEIFDGTALSLNGSYGLSLGEVSAEFTVAAMAKISSSGGTQTLFFKNMATTSAENWTSIIFDNGTPAVWANGHSGYGWGRMITASASVLNKWAHIAYTEKDGTASLYVNGALAGTASATSTGGRLYAFSTLWSADAPSGLADKLYINSEKALSVDEIKALYADYTDYIFDNISVPSATTENLSLPSEAGGYSLSWESSNESVITSNGVITRTNEDQTATLSVYVDGTFFKAYDIRVLKLPSAVNPNLVLSYDFSEISDGIVYDQSGNGNHATPVGGLSSPYFDGADDYVILPEGLLSGLDSFTVTMRLRPGIAKTHQFTFCFGNSTNEYFFLNTSRPSTNTIRAALTRSGAGGESDIRSVPGIRIGEEANFALSVNGTTAKMYLNGIPVAESELGFAPKELGKTTQKYLAKSPYSADALYSGYIYEFAIYPAELSAEDIAEMHSVPDEADGYIKDFVFTENGIYAELERDCMVSAMFFDKDGKTLSASAKKVSLDNLTVSFECEGAASAEIAAFDAATGIIKDRRAAAFGAGLEAYSEDGSNVRVVNTTARETNAVVLCASYGSDSTLRSVDAVTVTVEPGSFTVVSVPKPENGRLLVWSSLAGMQPVAKQE